MARTPDSFSVVNNGKLTHEGISRDDLAKMLEDHFKKGSKVELLVFKGKRIPFAVESTPRLVIGEPKEASK